MSVTAAMIKEVKAKITAPDQFFALHDVEMDGETYKAYQHAPKTITELITNARNHGDNDFLVYEDKRYTFNQFFARVDALGALMQDEYGIQKGDRVAIAMRNNPEWAMAYAAATLLGAIVVPINSWGKKEELCYAVTDSGSKVLVADRQRYKLISEDISGLNINVVVVDEDESKDLGTKVRHFEHVINDNMGKTFEVCQADTFDDCLILYTSGSTGSPKGVLHRHVSVCQSLMNMMFLGYLCMEVEGGAREFRGGAEQETPLITVPLFHATGLLSGLLIPIQMGYKGVMMYKWDSLKALQLIEAEKITTLTSVPAILQDFLQHPEFPNYNTGTLLRVSAAGAATPPVLAELMAEKLQQPVRSTGYGMTETMAVCSTMSGMIYDLKPEAAGVLSPIVEFRTVDEKDSVLKQGEAGEIELRTICSTPGYWEKPEANAKTFMEHRWMKTGDVGLLDEDHYVHITGRIKELVIRGGENIYPGEIENIAYEYDGIKENVVFGVPDQAMGEEMVMVYYAPNADVKEDALRAYLNDRIAGYKVPKYIVQSDQELPRNASEKLHKLKVREEFIAMAMAK